MTAHYATAAVLGRTSSPGRLPSYHFAPEVRDWLAQHPRFQFHFTPTHASWLNHVECWFSLISRKAIRRGVFDCKGDLHSALMAYVSHWNGQAHPFDWAYGAPLLENRHACAA
jgi:hypothetical protein